MARNRNSNAAKRVKRHNYESRITSIVYRLSGREISPASFADIFGAGLISYRKKLIEETGAVIYLARLRSATHEFWLERHTGAVHVRAIFNEPILPSKAAHWLRCRLGDYILKYGE